MNIIITTQYRENYGAHAWNGEGECPQYWKNKGGNEYMVTDVDVNGNLNLVSERAIKHFDCNHNSDYSCEYVLDWFPTDDSNTEEEKAQLEYEGKIIYPSKRVKYSELV